tara:strand:+ start:5978 stop:6493 length:516 start_codon:yes stop_codon:yes gene_type:complete
MTPLKKVQTCLGLNVFLLTIILTVIFSLGRENTYFRMGWSDDFVLVGVTINSFTNYMSLLLLIAIMNAVKVIVSELGEPVLIFNVYNPDKKVVTDFTRNQLLIYANLFFFISNTRRVFDILITVTQIDIALFSIILEQLVSICTVCMLVKEKKFESNGVLNITSTTIDPYL